MRDVTITLLLVVDSHPRSIEYTSAVDAACDDGLRCLFDNHLITSCFITRKGKRLAGLPHMTWAAYQSALDRFVR